MMMHTDNKYYDFFRSINIDRLKYNEYVNSKYDSSYKLSTFSNNYLVFYIYIDYLMEFERITSNTPFISSQYAKCPSQIELDRIHDLLKNREPKRVKIVGEVYNFKSKSVEYELEDGTYIPKNSPHNTMEELDVNIIPGEFLRLYDNVKFRNDVIENILKDE